MVGEFGVYDGPLHFSSSTINVYVAPHNIYFLGLKSLGFSKYYPVFVQTENGILCDRDIRSRLPFERETKSRFVMDMVGIYYRTLLSDLVSVSYKDEHSARLYTLWVPLNRGLYVKDLRVL